jgi:hypothetical protein
VIKIGFFINLKSFRLNGSLTVWDIFPLFSTVIFFIVDANGGICACAAVRWLCAWAFGGMGVYALFSHFFIFDFLFAYMPVIPTFAP